VNAIMGEVRIRRMLGVLAAGCVLNEDSAIAVPGRDDIWNRCRTYRRPDA
jgi:hypothetical protein